MRPDSQQGRACVADVLGWAAAVLAAVVLVPAHRPLAQGREPTSVLLVILDDVGVGQVSTCGENPAAVATPSLDALAARGVLFPNAWGHPVCSPTRAAILTGRHAFRTGCGISVDWSNLYDVATSETFVPELVDYDAALIGKWHLTNKWPLAAAYLKPVTFGFDLHAGAIKNIGTENSYYAWERNVAVAGSATQSTSAVYATTQNVDDALAFFAAAEPPWFCVLAFSAAHGPWEDPPPGLHTVRPLDSDSQRYRAMIQATDTELARLLAHVDLDETTVLVMGDNGPPQEVAGDGVPLGHAKGTVYEGGVNVPLLVSGALVRRPGRRCEQLVGDVDLFPTVLELLGVVAPPSDGVSLVPYLVGAAHPAPRTTVYTETFDPNGPPPYSRWDWAIRDRRHKLVSRDGAHELYDLRTDPREGDDLLLGPLTEAQQAAHDALLLAAQALQGS